MSILGRSNMRRLGWRNSLVPIHYSLFLSYKFGVKQELASQMHHLGCHIPASSRPLPVEHVV